MDLNVTATPFDPTTNAPWATIMSRLRRFIYNPPFYNGYQNVTATPFRL
ncbi:MAG: hypothetical protein IPH31_21350 [Lewinellaceae bacterium]|nr:hypothetical protein [Lewinellaceae bacterium]